MARVRRSPSALDQARGRACFPLQLSLQRVIVHSRSRLRVPTPSSCLAQETPAGTPERCAALLRQSVSDQFEIAHGPGCSPAGGIEHGTGVLGAVGADPGNLGGPGVLRCSSDGPADDGDAADVAVRMRYPDGKDSTAGGLVMPMLGLDKRVRLTQRDRRENQSSDSSASSSGSGSGVLATTIAS